MSISEPLRPMMIPGTRGVDADHQLVGGALDIDRIHAGRLQPLLQLLAQNDVFVQQVGIIALGEPARLPALVVAQPKPVRMCFLPQTCLPLCYFFFCDSLARFSMALRALRTAPRTPLDACSSAATAAARDCGRLQMLGDGHLDMAGALLVTEAAAHRRGTHALPARTFVHAAVRHVERVHVERCAGIVRLAFGVGDRAAQRLFHVFRDALLGELQRLQGLFRALAADQIDHQPRLLRRHAHKPRDRRAFNLTVSLFCRCHRLCPLPYVLWRSGSAACGRRAGRAGAAPAALSERRLHRVAFEGSRGGKLAQLVPHHLLGDVHGNKLPPVVHRDGVANHVRQDRRPARPRLHDFLFVSRIHPFHLHAQVVVDKGTLL